MYIIIPLIISRNIVVIRKEKKKNDFQKISSKLEATKNHWKQIARILPIHRDDALLINYACLG